jgi:uncharacterized protein YceH (UPF0502 family)
MGFVKELPRLPGSREPRHAHLLSGDVEVAATPDSPPAADHAPSLADRVAALEEKLDQTIREFEEFRRRFE